MKARLFLQPCFFHALACVTASHRFHFMRVLSLTQIPLIPLNCTPDGKSHRGFTLLLKKRHPILSI